MQASPASSSATGEVDGHGTGCGAARDVAGRCGGEKDGQEARS